MLFEQLIGIQYEGNCFIDYESITSTDLYVFREPFFVYYRDQFFQESAGFIRSKSTYALLTLHYIIHRARKRGDRLF